MMMMMVMMKVMVVEVQSRLQAISRGKGAFDDPADRQTQTQTQYSILSFLSIAFIIFLLLAYMPTLWIWFETLGNILRTPFTFILLFGICT